MDINTRRYNDLISAYHKEYFEVKKQLQFEKSTQVVEISQRWYSEIWRNNNWIETKRSNQEK